MPTKTGYLNFCIVFRGTVVVATFIVISFTSFVLIYVRFVPSPTQLDQKPVEPPAAEKEDRYRNAPENIRPGHLEKVNEVLSAESEEPIVGSHEHLLNSSFISIHPEHPFNPDAVVKLLVIVYYQTGIFCQEVLTEFNNKAYFPSFFKLKT